MGKLFKFDGEFGSKLLKEFLENGFQLLESHFDVSYHWILREIVQSIDNLDESWGGLHVEKGFLVLLSLNW